MPTNAKQIEHNVIIPVLKYLDPVIGFTQDAVTLLLGTAAQESHMGTYIKQLGSGPACGIFQMEPATHNDIWENFLRHKPLAAEAIMQLNMPVEISPSNVIDFDKPEEFDYPDAHEMIGNMYYATAMCRVHYWRVKEALPHASDLIGQARYWKKYYNTIHGAGTEQEYVDNFTKFVNGGR